jgi:hypothetical protein
MKRYFNITHLEYLEYMQNGCIRAKDCESPSRGVRKIYCESYEKPTFYDVLDAESAIRIRRGYGHPFVKKVESYSFGTLIVEDLGDNYLIEVKDVKNISRLMKRLELEGLHPEQENIFMINCLKLNNKCL